MRVKIVDMHEEDGYYHSKEDFIGRTGEWKYGGESAPGFAHGQFTPDEEENNIYTFYAIKVEKYTPPDGSFCIPYFEWQSKLESGKKWKSKDVEEMFQLLVDRDNEIVDLKDDLEKMRIRVNEAIQTGVHLMELLRK